MSGNTERENERIVRDWKLLMLDIDLYGEILPTFTYKISIVGPDRLPIPSIALT